jgi:hypothetical protein
LLSLRDSRRRGRCLLRGRRLLLLRLLLLRLLLLRGLLRIGLKEILVAASMVNVIVERISPPPPLPPEPCAWRLGF